MSNKFENEYFYPGSLSSTMMSFLRRSTGVLNVCDVGLVNALGEPSLSGINILAPVLEG